MKKKQILIISIVAIIILLIGGGTYYVLTKQDKNTTLTLLEKQWIEKNKNSVIDLSIPNNVPVFDYDGQGIFFDFINDLEKTTGLEFNKVSYNLDDKVNSDYYFNVNRKIDKSDILIYQDHYVLITNTQNKYLSLNDMSSMVIGVLKDNLSEVNKYMDGANVTYKTYEKAQDMVDALEKDGQTEIQGIVLPRILYLGESLKSKSLFISYHIDEMKDNYVLHLGNNKKLNTILKKYFKKWNLENFEDSYYTNLTQMYFSFNSISEKAKTKFRSKRYSYGFVEYIPYDKLFDGELIGINHELIKVFSKLADVEISFKKYNSISSLVDDFNKNRIDLFMNNTSSKKYDMDVKNTVAYQPLNLVILSSNQNNVVVHSIASLENQKVMVIKDSKISKYLSDKGVKTLEYNNVDDLLAKVNDTSVIAIDYEAYEYYSKKELLNYKVDYMVQTNQQYGFTVRDIKDNEVFYDFYNYFLSYITKEDYISNGKSKVLNVNVTSVILKYILIGAITVIVVIAGIFILKFTRKKKDKKPVYNKESKLKYIDILTSLKNRTYLNDHIEKWDNSEVYPQTIVIVDLNNVAYINDNYGHQEGDNLIKEAANILIKTQIENSDIIRTDGNEFLIYLVGHDEKQVISYTRKLSKEMKELAHGFGAAIGYSMINDAIKTIDDAVNEATSDMRNNKQES